MEVKRSALSDHATGIARILASLYSIKLTSPLIRAFEDVGSREIVITIPGGPPISSLPQRTVTTDLGRTEKVIGLPIPEASEAKFWIGLHESWEFSGKYRASFRNCGLRIYIGAQSENATQFLRLEWVAPDITKDGITVYQGGHAGHPHWHIDRAALVGPEEHLRSLEMLTAPTVEESPLEPFRSEMIRTDTVGVVQDLSWLRSVHLPAQAGWMHQNWDGLSLPAPHQSAPLGLQMLTTWWEGALRYLFAELSQHASV